MAGAMATTIRGAGAMARHVERRLDRYEPHTCGRCGWTLAGEGAWVMHACDVLSAIFPRGTVVSAPPVDPLLAPVPDRLIEAWDAHRERMRRQGMAIDMAGPRRHVPHAAAADPDLPVGAPTDVSLSRLRHQADPRRWTGRGVLPS